jgi:hypothetical protein
MRNRIPPPFITLFAAALMWALQRWLPLGRLLDPPLEPESVMPADPVLCEVQGRQASPVAAPVLSLRSSPAGWCARKTRP